MRTFVYIDGFNLYYRALRNTTWKWLDLKQAIVRLLDARHCIASVKYFTARVSAPSDDPGKPVRQQVYLRALQAHTPELEIYYGHFLTHKVPARLVTPIGDRQSALVYRTEEKGSDVNLAVHLLNDAALDRYDCAVLVSNDSDMAEALRLARVHHHKNIGLVTPGKAHPSKQLARHSDFRKYLGPNVLASSQLPNPIPKTNIHKPQGW